VSAELVISEAQPSEHERTLRGVLRVGAIVLTAMVVTAPLTGLGLRRGLMQYGPGVVLHLGHLYWLKYGKVSVVAISHCMTYFVWVTLLLALAAGGMTAPAAFVYPPLVVMAGLVWSGRAAIAMALLTSAAGLLLAVLSEQDVLPPDTSGPTPIRLWMVMTACVVVTAALMRFALDVIERSNRERLRNAARFADLVRAAPDAMVFVSRDFVTRAGNPALERMLGRPVTDVIGKRFNQLGLFSGEAETQLEARMEHTLQDGKPRVLELLVKPAAGVERPVEVLINRVGGERRRFRIHLNIRDITERAQSARLQEQLRKGQRLESLGRLAGGVAHDFNNMLTIILGSVELLQRRSPSEETQAIKEAATRAVSLTRQLLAFGRRQVLQAESVELGRAFEEARPLLERLLHEEIRLEVMRPPRPVYAVVDRAQLDQVLINLVVNARDAMPRGGSIRLECGECQPVPSPVPDMTPGAEESAAKMIWIAVTDTGVGLAPDVRDRIFEPFFTTKGAGLGTGLGLATVHGIVAQSGGEIRVESEVGRGTRFYVTLPRGQAPSTDGARAKAGAPQKPSARLLVVEDEPALRTVVKAMLESGGYSVAVAPSPLQALELLTAAKPRFDLLLTDVVMYGMSGPELARNARARQPELRVLFISGHADELIEARGALRTDVQFIAKPFMTDALLRRVAEVLAMSAPALPEAEKASRT
jgi:PAS domain S-box-containing protein